MCGVVGYRGSLGTDGEQVLDAMVDALSHRGPDGRSAWVHEDVGLAAVRLSLLDLDHGGQPMVDGELAVVFNGEIYNHRELRAELEREGVAFRGRSDTEVVLRGFRRWGAAVLEKLEGMFAVAICEGGTLHLARDPFGMKPLFYWVSPQADAVAFASEIKALLRCPTVPRRLDPAGLVEQLVFGHTLGSRSLMAGVCHVPPGAHVIVERREGRIVVATSHPSLPPQAPPERMEHAVDALVERLRASVERHVHADHPIATYLSGGLDSTLVAALRPDRAGSRSFVVADGKDVADVRYARSAATALGLDHGEIMIPRAPALSWVADAVLAMEAPVLPSLALVSAAQVRRTCKAALCGEGSDEVFAGYPIHEDPEPYLRGLEERLLRLHGAAPILEHALATTRARIAALRLVDPEARFRAVHDFLLRETMPNKHLAIWDRCAMAASLEVRMPFLERGIRDLGRSLPREWMSRRKQIVVAAARRVLPPALATQIDARAKSAAPDALGATRQRLRGLAGAAMPRTWLRRHPLQQLSSSPHALVLLDLFLLAFVAGDGRLPEGFAIEAMYARHEGELRRVHQEACEALWGASGSAP